MSGTHPVDYTSLCSSAATYVCFVFIHADGGETLRILEMLVAFTAVLVNGFKMYDWIVKKFLKPKNKKDEEDTEL